MNNKPLIERAIMLNMIGNRPVPVIVNVVDDRVYRLDIEPDTWLDGFIDGMTMANVEGITYAALTNGEAWTCRIPRELIINSLSKRNEEYRSGAYEGIRHAKDAVIMTGTDRTNDMISNIEDAIGRSVDVHIAPKRGGSKGSKLN